MAIRSTDITFGSASGGTYTSGALHNLFPAGQVGGATDYRLVEVRNNNGTLTLSAPKAWLSIDTRGAAVALAVADLGTARAISYMYPSVDAAALTYSTPTTFAAGLALPALAAGQKCLIAVRRTLTGATAVYPESNRLNVSGTSPI